MWSTGCVIAEMFLGEPLFPGNTSKNQLIRIMKLLGNPTKDDLKNMGRNLNPKLPEYPAKPFHKVPN